MPHRQPDFRRPPDQSRTGCLQGLPHRFCRSATALARFDLVSFSLHFDWESTRSCRPELAHTFSYLQIRQGQTCLTRVFSTRTNGLREGIFVPLFPIAEWAIRNWWFLWEDWHPHRFPEAHQLSSASEGYALPRLELRSSESRVKLTWQKYRHDFASLEFLEGGEAYAEKVEVQEQFSRLIESVLDRLASAGFSDDNLLREWQAIQSVERNQEEQEFCSIAARLGLDPFALEPAQASMLEDLATDLPWSLLSEIAAHSRSSEFRIDVQSVRHFIQAAAGEASPAIPWSRFRSKEQSSNLSPAHQGYLAARQLRQDLGLTGPIPKLEHLLSESLGTGAVQPLVLPNRLVSAVALNSLGGPVFGLQSVSRDDQKRFRLARAMGSYFLTGQSAVVGEGNSEQQQLNRAFAAEFLAPAADLAQLISVSDDFVSSSQISDLSDTFGVSTELIARQIENHSLGIVLPA